MGGGSTDARGHGAAPAERAGSAWPTTADYAAMPAVGGGVHTDAPATSRAAAVQEGVSGSYRSATDAVNAASPAQTERGPSLSEVQTDYALKSLTGNQARIDEYNALSAPGKAALEVRFYQDEQFRDGFRSAMNDGKSIEQFRQEFTGHTTTPQPFPPAVGAAATAAAMPSAERIPAGTSVGGAAASESPTYQALPAHAGGGRRTGGRE